MAGTYGLTEGVNRAYDKIADERARQRRLGLAETESQQRQGYLDLAQERGQRDEQRLQSTLGLQAIQTEVQNLKRDQLKRQAKDEGVRDALSYMLRGDLKGAEKAYNAMGEDRLHNITAAGDSGLYVAQDDQGNPVTINPYIWADMAGLSLEKDGSGNLRILDSKALEARRARELEATKHKNALELESTKHTGAMELERLKGRNALAKSKTDSGKAWTIPEADKHIKSSIYAGVGGFNFQDSDAQRKDRAAKAALAGKVVRAQKAAGKPIDPNAAIDQVEKFYKSDDEIEKEVRAEVDSEAHALESDQSQFGHSRDEEVKQRVQQRKDEIQKQIENIGKEDQAAAASAQAAGQPQGGNANMQRLIRDETGTYPQVTTQAELDALKPGDIFFDPNGVKRRK